jgi:opacity protein-like surface antigen
MFRLHAPDGGRTVIKGKLLMAAVLSMALAPAAFAQQSQREKTWEFFFDINYQDSYKMDFEGGSTADTDADVGWSIGGNYHFSNRLQFQFAFDWIRVDYDAEIRSADPIPDPPFGVRGEMEVWTPRFNALFNFLDRNLTPYVSAGIGWSFIDTNIPTGPPQTGCWWDPWWGYVCTTYQNTRDTDEFAYQAGAGVRWDVNRQLSLRLGYEKQWYDIGTAESAPGFDLIRFGLGYRY